MEYNVNRKKLEIREYGRNIQKMVDYALEIGYSYSFTLDPFGRIYNYRKELFNSQSRFAIVRKAAVED